MAFKLTAVSENGGHSQFIKIPQISKKICLIFKLINKIVGIEINYVVLRKYKLPCICTSVENDIIHKLVLACYKAKGTECGFSY